MVTTIRKHPAQYHPLDQMLASAARFPKFLSEMSGLDEEQLAEAEL